MRARHRWLLLVLLALVPLGSGCAKLSEWLEGAAEEEESKDEKTPEEILAEETKNLAGDDAAKRKDAIGKIGALKLEEALRVVLQHLRDHDPAVVKACLSVLQTVTGFPEKTDDERQLDPEGYDQQLAFKQIVVEQGQRSLAKLLHSSDDEIQYGALIVFYNLGQAPVVPPDAKDQLRAEASGAIVELAQNAEMPTDARLLAIEALVLYEAADSVGQLVPLLDDPDEQVRARTALALGQVTAAGAQGAESKLLALAADGHQPWTVRWAAAAALGRLGAQSVSGLTTPFRPPVDPDAIQDPESPDIGSALDAYRAFALANAKTPEAQQLVAELNQQMDAAATQAEEQLEMERKKGYR